MTPYEEDEEETPRPRQSKRVGGGKYHPGLRPSAAAQVVDSSPPHHEVSRRTSRQSSIAQSDVESVLGSQPSDDESQESNHDEDVFDDSAESDDFDEMDQTVRVNLDTPLARQLNGRASTVRGRKHLRSSPGHTPARRLLGHANDFTADLTPVAAFNGKSVQTPRQLNFANPPSFFDVQKTPFLAATSPYKLNTAAVDMEPVQYQDYDDEMQNGEEDWVNPEDADEFLQFSPEKKAQTTRTPFKLRPVAASSPIPHTVDSSTPVKDFLGMFEKSQTVRKPRATSPDMGVGSKRRRQTAEFRQFSAIDLEQLKHQIPPVPEVVEGEDSIMADVVENDVPVKDDEDMLDHHEDVEDGVVAQEGEEEEQPVAEAPVEEEAAVQSPKSQQEVAETIVGQEKEVPVEEKVPIEEEKVEEEDKVMADKPEEAPEHAVEDAQVEVHEEAQEEEEAKPAELTSEQVVEEEGAPTTEAPAKEPTPAAEPKPEQMPARLYRTRRSMSCPPAPQPERARELTPEQLLIQTLRERILDLEYGLRQTKARLANECRVRHAAQETLEFLNLERIHGVCCEHAPGAKRAEKRGVAAIPLPNSSPTSVTESAITRPASRMTARPESRLGARPASRLGAPRQAAAYGARQPVAASTNTIAGKKRARDEPPSRKPALARPEKRVLGATSSIASGNIPTASGALAKKPEKIGTYGRPPTRTGAHPAPAASTRPASRVGLARGARR